MKHTVSLLKYQMPESQAHGLAWEDYVKREVYKIQEKARYTRKNDIDSNENTIDSCAVSIKTSGSLSVDMGDARRIFEETGGEPYHMVLIQYNQAEGRKILKAVLEVDLTGAREELFGSLTLEDVTDFHQELKKIPNGPVKNKDYLIRSAELNAKSKGLVLRPKVDSKTQRRLQCAFPDIDAFCTAYPERLLYKNTEGVFKGVQIMKTLESGPRVRHTKTHE
jgi:hypothetical protein